jgi:putative flippase GtrA
MTPIPCFSTERVSSKNSLPVQIFSYGVVGGIAAVVDVGSFYVFVTYMLIYYPVAIFFSFSLGTFVNFLLCNSFIFDRGVLPLRRTFFRHYLSSLGGLATNELVVFSLYGIVHFQNILAAKIIATFAAFFVNFTLLKFYAFNSRVSLRDRIRGKK